MNRKAAGPGPRLLQQGYEFISQHLVKNLIITGIVIAIVFSLNLHQEPKFDETGNLILSLSLASGNGYREIDKPDAPPHAHYPPGWPLALAILSHVPVVHSLEPAVRAHLAVVCLWMLSLYVWWRFFCRVCGTHNNTGLMFALLLNWTWIRLAGELRSESLFIFLTGLFLLTFQHGISRNSQSRVALSGLILGLSILTRHAGVALWAAVCCEMVLQKKLRLIPILTIVVLLCLGPWIWWQLQVGQGTQAELVVADNSGSGFARLLLSQLQFYLIRMPDSLFGPFLEIATVFQNNPIIKYSAFVAATLFLIILICGIFNLIKSESTRLPILYLICSILMLIVWPFTEAGRFLIPLVPVLLLATLSGFNYLRDRINCCISIPARLRPDWLLVLLVMPFGIYTTYKNYSEIQNTDDIPFNQACHWLKTHTPQNAIIMSRHPGDVFWRSQRKGVNWPDVQDIRQVHSAMKSTNSRYLIVDRDRFARAPVPAWASKERLGSNNDLFRDVTPDNVPADSIQIFERTD